MGEAFIAGLPASVAIVLIVWGLRQIGLEKDLAPAAAVVVGVVLSVAMHGPYGWPSSPGLVVEAVVVGVGWAAVAVGGHSAVMHSWKAVRDGSEGPGAGSGPAAADGS